MYVDILNVNSIISAMGLRSKNHESLQASPHQHAFLLPVLKSNDLNVGLAMHVFYALLPWHSEEISARSGSPHVRPPAT